MQDAGIVTPEAVRLEFEGAGLGSRVLALLLDVLIQTVILLGAIFFGAALAGAFGSALPDWVPVVAVTLLGFAVVWGYPVGCETLTRGRTPGKAALGLRVVTREGAPIRFRHAAIRGTLSLVDYLASAGAVAVIAILVTKRQQRLGDLVAGTVVLRERTVGGSTSPVRFSVPAGAEGYAQTVDSGALPAQDYQRIRAYLLRAPSLRADARARLSAELAARTAAALAQRPPAWVTPEVFLVIVAARYQQRPGAGPLSAPAPFGAPPPAVGGAAWSPPGSAAPRANGSSAWSPPPGAAASWSPSPPSSDTEANRSPVWAPGGRAAMPAPPSAAPTGEADAASTPDAGSADRGFAPPS